MIIATWLAAWRERRAKTRSYRESMAGFDYALSVLREETNPELHRQLDEQAAGDDSFCLGMRIAIAGFASLPTTSKE
jgi:hypothetical protein